MTPEFDELFEGVMEAIASGHAPDADMEYMTAVESGDLAAAGKLVMKAAEDNYYTVGPVWHGSRNNEFNTFRIPSKGFNSNALGSWDVERHAAFFTPDMKAAEGYSTQGGVKSGGTRRFMLEIGSPFEPRMLRYEGVLNSLEDRGVNIRWLLNKKTWELFDKEEDPEGIFIKALRDMGYDGAVFEEEDPESGNDITTYAVFDPNQIKSADTVTKDDSGNIIPLSKRFDHGTSDTRF